jgi:hypothetical protein
MATSKLAFGPQVTIDKMGRKLYWIDRKRVKESVYLAASTSTIEIDYGSGTVRSVDPILDQLDELLSEVRRQLQPATTDKERTLLAFCQWQDSGKYAGYAEALTVAGSAMAANALIGSLQRKGLIRYESKEEARFRLISTEDRFYHLTSPEVQEARIIEPTALGAQIGNAQLQAELTLA